MNSLVGWVYGGGEPGWYLLDTVAPQVGQAASVALSVAPCLVGGQDSGTGEGRE